MTKRPTSISGITAPALAISAANAAASTVDPIIPAIQDYVQLYSAWWRLCEAEQRAEKIAREGRCIVPKESGGGLGKARDAMTPQPGE
jgi:hypothetical protein